MLSILTDTFINKKSINHQNFEIMLYELNNIVDFENYLKKTDNDETRIHGIVLCTPMDYLWMYFRHYHESIDSLAKNSCLLFEIHTEYFYHYPSDIPVSTMEYIQKKEPELFDKINNSKNIHISFTAYDMTHYLKIKPNKLPCIVFFKDPSDMDLLVYSFTRNNDKPIDDMKITTELRDLFSAIMIDDENITKNKQRDKRWKKLVQFVDKKDSENIFTQTISLQTKLSSTLDMIFKVFNISRGFM